MDTYIKKFNNYNGRDVEISWWKPSTWLQWKSPSIDNLIKAEKAVLSDISDKIACKYTPIMNGNQHIHSISLNVSSPNTPILLLHGYKYGMGSGVGLWSMNLRELSASRPVYAIDILGFGASSRHKFGIEASLIEAEFVDSIEEWREEIGLEKFILLGHSMGGFLSAAYALKYPKRLQHLVLVDPWGVSERPSTTSPSRTPMPIWIRLFAGAMQTFNPLALLRAAGPFGDIQQSIQITMMYGSRSWIDNAVGWQIKYIRENSYVDVQIFKGAGHHFYADKSEEFNYAVNKICRTVDIEQEQGFSVFSVNRRRRVQSENAMSYTNNTTNGAPYNRYIQSETSITEEKSEEEEKTTFTCGPEDAANKTI